MEFWSGGARAPGHPLEGSGLARNRLDDVRARSNRESKSLETHGHMFVGGLDTNDQDETEEWDKRGYVDERAGLELDVRLTKRAEAEEIEFMKTNCLYDVMEKFGMLGEDR